MHSRLSCRKVGENYYLLTLILSYLIYFTESEGKYFMLQDLEGDNNWAKVEGKSLYV